MSDFNVPPPISFVPGHIAGCYDAAGNYRKCYPGCSADRSWYDNNVRQAAYAKYDLAMRTAGRVPE